MPATRKHAWLVLKSVLAAVIVVAVWRQFDRILSAPELRSYSFRLRPELLLPAALLYLAAHTLWGDFWLRLLRSQGVAVSRYTGLRAYFVSQFGKYVPGKAWVILIRVAMLKAVGGRSLPVAVTATYETLTSMAAGAMLGVLLLPWLGVLPEFVSKNVAFLAAMACLPVGLAVLNKLAVRVAAKRRAPDAPPLPSPGLWLLARGLLQAACGWCLLGLSLGLVAAAVAPSPPAWDLPTYLADLAAVSLSYVVGFVVLVAPGGIGPREIVLQYALTPRFAPELGEKVAAGQAVVVALVLRLVWTAAEVVVALGVWARPVNSPHDERRNPHDSNN
jgi:hypothetical protein